MRTRPRRAGSELYTGRLPYGTAGRGCPGLARAAAQAFWLVPLPPTMAELAGTLVGGSAVSSQLDRCAAINARDAPAGARGIRTAPRRGSLTERVEEPRTPGAPRLSSAAEPAARGGRFPHIVSAAAIAGLISHPGAVLCLCPLAQRTLDGRLAESQDGHNGNYRGGNRQYLRHRSSP